MREIPAVHRFLDDPAIAPFETLVGREAVKAVIAKQLQRTRTLGRTPPFEELVAAVVAELESLRLGELTRAINATGIVVHTNLGRAPLAIEAIEAAAALGRGYSNLEYDLDAGERGSRYERVTPLLCEVTGAQDALVVNNCAAAVLLVLDTFAKGREVVVARTQLVEIGGGFRIPEVLERSGARLIEVGATNRVRCSDYERALSPRTSLLLRTHPSNYRIEGFTEDVGGAALAELGRRSGVTVVEDLGSGALVDLERYGLPHERTVQEALADGIGLVTFSADKLLGGPQAGIVCGTSLLVGRLRANPLVRALRVGKLTLAALAATLRLYRRAEDLERIPVYRMLAATVEELRVRARAYEAVFPVGTVGESDAYTGGGSLPQARLASIAFAVPCDRPQDLAARLRRGDPAVVARVEGHRLMLDLRTIAPGEDAATIAALQRAIR